MATDFTTLHNYYEQQVVNMVMDLAHRYPLLTEDHHPDVACVALNRLPPRYIRHQVDLERAPGQRAAHPGHGGLRLRIRAGALCDAGSPLSVLFRSRAA